MRPWDRHGWLDDVVEWIDVALGSVGASRLGTVHRLRWWPLSVTLSIETSFGKAYFKCGARAPLLAREAVLCESLSHIFGTYVPQVIAVCQERNWLLISDAGPTLAPTTGIEDRLQLVSAHARFQRKAMALCSNAERLGVQVRPPSGFGSHVETLLNDDAAAAQVTDGERERLSGYLPVIDGLEAVVATSSVPLTVIHGDLHLQNVAHNSDGGFTLLDWTEACVTHPFFDMFMIYNEGDKARCRALRERYLSEWSDFDSFEKLDELWSASSVLHALHHATSYASLVNNTALEARGEFVEAVAFLVRKALRYLEQTV